MLLFYFVFPIISFSSARVLSGELTTALILHFPGNRISKSFICSNHDWINSSGSSVIVRIFNFCLHFSCALTMSAWCNVCNDKIMGSVHCYYFTFTLATWTCDLWHYRPPFRCIL